MSRFAWSAGHRLLGTVYLVLVGALWLVPAPLAARRLFADPVQVIPQPVSPVHILEHTFPGGVRRLLITSGYRQVQFLDPGGANPWQPLAGFEMDGDTYDGNFDYDARLLLADVNEDAIDDMILESGPIFVAPGRADGSYAPPFAWDMAGEGAAIFVQDVNGDGHVDLVRPNYGNRLVTFRAGRGDGRFNPTEDGFPVPSEELLVAADMTGDGLIDLLRAGRDTLALTRYVADGAGGFQRTTTSPLSSDLDGAIGLGRMDDDSEPDLVTIDYSYSFLYDQSTYRLSIHSGLGDGYFADPVASLSVERLEHPSLFDVDGDGYDDVVSHSSGLLSMYRNRGDGTLEPRTDVVNTTGEGVPYFHDFDGDGRPDILVTAFQSLRLVTRADIERFPAPPSIPLPFANRRPLLVDMDGDGRLDLVGIGKKYQEEAVAFIRPGLAGGSFGTTQTTRIPQLLDQPNRLDAADLDGDGDTDLFGTIGYRDAAGVVLENDGSGGLVAGILTPLGFELYSPLRFKDLDGDGLVELLHHSFDYVFGAGDTTFVDILRVSPTHPVTPLGRLAIPGVLDGFLPADVDQDGQDELIAWSPRYYGSGLRILRRVGGFSYEVGPLEPLPDIPGAILPGDWLPDPGLELVVSGSRYLSIMARDADGAWTIRQLLSGRRFRNIELIPDMNGDGRPELGASATSESSIDLYLSNPITGFGDATEVPVGSRGWSPLFADLSGDGQPDFISYETDSTLAIRHGLRLAPPTPTTLTALADDWSVNLDWFLSNPLEGDIEVWRLPVGASSEAEVRLDPVVSAAATGRLIDSTLRTSGRYRYRLVHRDPEGYGQTLAANEVEVQPDPGPMRLLSVMTGPGPGPFRLSYEIRASGSVRLDIFSITGRRVRSHELGALGPSRGEVEWNGRGDDGRRVASGIYFARLAGSTSTLRLVLLR